MGLKIFKDAGVHDLMRETALLISKRGLAKGVRIDPTNGSVDLIAAVALCCGAKENELLNSITIVDFTIPQANEVKFFMAMEALDASRPDFDIWADRPDVSIDDVIKLLEDSAGRLSTAIV